MNDQFPFYLKNRTDTIFVHIRKTGGTSIKRSLGSNKCVDQLGKAYKKHITALDIINIIGQKKWKEAFKFTFVRNPWDRMVSQHYFIKKKTEEAGGSSTLNFKSWLKKHIKRTQATENMGTMYRPQVRCLECDNRQIDIDFIGRFEQLEKDFASLKYILKIDTTLVHINKTEHQHYRTYYDDESKKLIATFYEEDIDTFKYLF